MLLVYTLLHVEGTCNSQSFKEKRQPHAIITKFSFFIPSSSSEMHKDKHDKLGCLGELKA